METLAEDRAPIGELSAGWLRRRVGEERTPRTREPRSGLELQKWRDGGEEVSRNFKQLDVARRLGQREPLPSFWLRRKRRKAGVLLPLWSLLPRLPGKTGALGTDRFAQTKPLFPSLADAQVQPEVYAQPSPLRRRGS